MSDNKLPADAVPQDFVYAGRRMGTKGYLLDEVYPLKADGTLDTVRLYKGDRAERVVGGVYTGTHFSPTLCYGISVARYTGTKYTKDRPQLVEWESKSQAAKTELAAQRLAKDDRKQTVIEEAMMPLREMYRSALSRGDYATAHAIEIACAQALKHPPPKK
jgi:hypothetical protein